MRKLVIKLAFIIPFVWWIYLFFTTQIIIVFDAEGYEQIGKMIHLQGWHEFFRTGPQREPFFSGLIALSMLLGDFFKISYFYPLKIFGAAFLFLTMVFSYRLMKKLSVHQVIAAAVIFYLGVSPVMTNSSMRLWSEFAAYPWIVLAVWWTIRSWQSMNHWAEDRQGFWGAARKGAVLGGLFLLIMSVKASAEAILIVYLWPFYWQILISYRSKNYIQIKRLVIFLAAIFLVFEGGVGSYKLANYISNGHYQYTGRWDWALWGYVKRRSEPMTFRKVEAAVAFVPGMDVCSKNFTPEECNFWSTRYSDDLDADKSKELSNKKLAEGETTKFFVQDSIRLLTSSLFQQVGLMFIEAHKIFFWESQIAFVAYPNWLEAILYSNPLMYGLKTILALLCWGAVVITIFCLCQRKRWFNQKGQEQAALLFVFNFIFWYTAAYSLYFIVDRYIFPIVSLLMILVAFAINQIWSTFGKKAKR